MDNLGGRPPIYEPTEENFAKVAELCQSYFDDEANVPPLVTGLTLHLGFADKSTLYDYAKKEGFSHSLKSAITKIEMYHEKAVAFGDKCTGNIFVLKNFNWKDTQAIDHTTDGKALPSVTALNITLPDGKTLDDFKID